MPAVGAPALWLSVAATTVSVVAVAAIASSGGPRRPLTFAGAILLPDGHHSAASQSAASGTLFNRPSASRTATPTPAAPSAAASTTGFQAPAPAVIPVQNTPSGIPAAPSSSPAAAASATRPASQAHTPRPGVPASPEPGSNTVALAHALFTALNDARRQAGLPPLNWSAGLQRSAAGHNQQMAAANELASRVGDEPALGARQANEGVLANYAAENVGRTEVTDRAGALAVQQLMLAEEPPDDSHRQNLLSTAVSAVGIDVLLDPAHGLLWITEDFAQLS
ncbi:MAG: CAP domain-containing protein [Jatrophihabitantaceae bacterium]